MEKLQHLKERICSFENLYAAYEDAAKEKHYREDVLAFTFNLEENLFDLQKDLLDGIIVAGIEALLEEVLRTLIVLYSPSCVTCIVKGSSVNL